MYVVPTYNSIETMRVQTGIEKKRFRQQHLYIDINKAFTKWERSNNKNNNLYRAYTYYYTEYTG